MKKTTTARRNRWPIFAMLACLSVAATWANQDSEEIAVRQFESGIMFAREGNYGEALKDFQTIVTQFPASSVADNAILEIARYHLEVGGDLDQAEVAANSIVNTAYAETDAAPEAYVILGRANLARGRTEEYIGKAISHLQRGLRLHPDEPMVPQGLFYLAEGHRLQGRLDEALVGYRRVVSEHPSSHWAREARIGTGMIGASSGDPVSAMEEFQRVRDEFPELSEGRKALARTTLLYRLFIRPSDSTYTITPPAEPGGTGRRVIALATTADGNVVYATDREVSWLRPSATPLPMVRRPEGLGLGPDGEVFVIEQGTLLRQGDDPIQFTLPQPGAEGPRVLRVRAVVATSTGDWLVADSQARLVQRFSRQGAHLGVYAEVRAVRLAIDDLDTVAVLDSKRQIYIYEAGRQTAEIVMRGDKYRIQNPVDIAFDVFGHLYVLDRNGVYIFGQDRRLLMWFPPSGDAPGAFDRATALTVDASGRLYVADERDKLVFTLQ